MESLEPRAMLAFSPLPAVGNMGGLPITLASDASGPNVLTIVLDDVTKSDIGAIAATITTSDGQSGQYWNFSGITYAASNDTDGLVVNTVKLWTSYEADVAGFETAPAADSEVGLATSWFVASRFPAGGAPVVLSMLNADRLTVTSGVIGGNASTIAGEFESPTLGDDLDATTGAQITLISGTGVTGTDLDGTADFEPIVAYTLTLQSQTAGVQLGTDVFTVGDLTINAAGTITLDGLLQSTSGDIIIASVSGNLDLSANTFFAHALDGSVVLESDCGTVVVERVCAEDEVVISAEKGVTIENDIDAGGDITVTAASGLVDSAQSSKQITSRDGAIMVSARTAFLGPMRAEQAINVDAQGAIVVSAVTSQAGDFSVLSQADSISLSGAIVAESVTGTTQREFVVLAPLTARTGDVTIAANDGTVALQADVIAVKGDIDLTGRAILQGGLGVAKVDIDDIDPTGKILGQKAGEGYSAATTKVVISAPRRGGTAAQAVPIVGKVRVGTTEESETVDGKTVTRQVPVFADSGIVQLILTSPGSGYEIGEPVTVTFVDPNVEAEASATVTLQSVVPSAALVADSGEVRLNATTEALTVQTIKAGSSVTLNANKAVTVTDSVVSGGVISLTTPAGGVTARDLLAAKGITIAGFEDARLSRQLYAKTGDIDIRSTSGSVAMAANVLAEDGALRVVAHRHVEQSLTGIDRVVVTNGGSGYTSANVTISPPSSGSGTAATARAILSPNGDAVLAIELVTVGEGYAAGETVSVLIEGAEGTGAAAYAVASNVTSSIAAETGVFINAGEDMRLVGVVRAEAGDIELRSKSGDLELGHPSLLIQAIDGGVVLATAAGTINSGLVIADSDISIKSDAASVFLNRGLASLQGGIEVEALGAITQSSDSGLAELLLVSRGTASGSPNVTVTIGAPSSGGRAAKAVAILARDGNGNYFIERLELIDRGSGYSVGERPIVEIAGIAGAAAQAIGPSGSERIVAETDITLKAGSSLLLTNRMLSARGDIAISSAQGNIDMTSDGAAVAQAVLGEVTIEAVAGQVTAQDVLAGTGIFLRSLGLLSVARNIASEKGDIRVESTAESVTLTANVHAKDGSLTVVSHQGVNQESDSGIRELVLIAGGGIEGLAPPRVRVLIAPPASGGGRPATAVAVIGRREVLRTDDDGGTETVIEYFVERLVVTDRGEGYAIGEAPAVTIDGGDLTGAAATAIGPTDLQLLKAKNDVTIAAQTDVTLRNLTVAETGSLTVTSDHGGLLLGGGAVVLSAAAGMVTLRSDERSVVVNRIIAGGKVVVDALLDASLLGDLTASGASPTLITARTGQAIATDVIVEGDLTISGHMGVSLRVITESRTGDVAIASNAGGVEVRSSVLAPQGRIEITAFDRFTQQSGTGIVGLTVLSEGALRSTNAPEVSVDIAAPRNGGVAARARAVLRRILIDDSDFDELANYEYSLDEVVLTDPGSGYEIGEAPDVTVNGLPGAVVLAVPRASSQIIAANDDIVIRAGDSVTLANRIQSDAGDIVIESLSGQIDAEENENPIDARAGALKIDARNGRASVSNVFAQEGITVSALETLTLGGNVVARGGDVVARSTGSSVLLRANVDAAAGDIDIVARSTVSQIGGTGLTRIEVTSGGRLTRERGAGDPIDPPSTPTVTVAPPRNGGTAARATAQVSVTSVGVENDGVIDRIIDTFTVVAIVLDDPGSGYEVGESPLVTIAGEIPGVAARAVGPLALPRVTAAKNLSVQGGDDVTLTSTFQAETGDIVITSVDGDLVLRDGFLAHAIAGDVALQAAVGAVNVQRVRSGGDTLIVGTQGVTIATDLNVEGDINIAARAGAVNSRQLVAGGAISLTSLALIDINDEVLARTGDITVQSTSGGVFLGANVHAAERGIRISALGGAGTITQRDSSGISGIDVVNAGSEISASPAAPTVTVEIAAPAGGGVAATGRAEIGRREISPDSPDGALSYEFFVRSIELTSSGRGYVSGENPTVTITGIANATARVRPIVGRAIVANTDLIAEAAADVTLRSTWRSNIGDVGIASVSGNLDLSADTFLAHAAAGGVTLTSSAGAVTVQQVTADDAVSISGATGVEILGLVNSATGSVTVDSTAGEAMIRAILASDGVTVGASHDVTLLGTIAADGGDISITSRNRDLDFTAAGAQLNALQGGVSLAAVNGTIMSPPTLHASKNVTLTSFNTLALNNEITSDTGVIDLKSTSGSINLGANLDARDDSIRIHAKGSVTQIGGGIGFVRVLNGGSGYTGAATVAIAAPSAGGIAARGMPIIGVNGVITGILITNPGSGYGAGEQPTVTFTRNAVPPAGALDASAMAVASPALGNSGLAAIDVLDGGSGYTATTIVTIAAPVGGGTAATAQAVIGTVEVNGDMTDGVILDIVIVNPGSGYGAGEQPVVTITGAGAGAVARAIANIALQDIRGGKDIDIYAGTGVTLLNTIRADQGGVSITSETGNVNLAARTLLVSSFMDDIEITSRRGAINVQRLAAEGDIMLKAQTGVTLLNAVNSTGDFGPGNVSIYTVNGNIAAVAPNGLISVQNGGVSLESVNGTILVPQVFNVTGDVSLKTFGNLTIDRPLTSSAGSVTVASATGAVNIAANVFADERVTLSAKTGISQTKGFLKGNELVARNSTTSAVNLTNPANDFANVSLMSLGAVSYVDANDFETGVERSPYSGMPLGVEVRGESLNLSSVGTNSRIRVVGGLSYKTLSIAAGTQGGNNVGYVEYVTTSTGDNPQTNAAFRGTLRDMIRYVNENTATYVNAGNTRVPQPQMMVFDETGYLVEEVTPSAALPSFSRPVWFDGGRLEETATANRLGLAGNNALAHGLAFAAAMPAVTGVRPATPGSAGSRVENLAVYGFTNGSGVVLGSGNNTVLDLHAGLKADGTVSGNMIGLDVRGAAAINNTIGEQVVDAETVNRFAANTLAGIIIRSGAAGTQVFGSVIGDGSGENPALANGDGIQIVNATRSQIGSADAVQDDLFPARSNVIAGNRSAGVRINNAVAGTLAAANVVRNNVIRGNRTGVDISASAFAVLGGLDARAANVITGQTLSGVVVTDSRSVQIQGNRIGVVPASGDQPEAVAGNGADGIAISGKSQGVEIGGGNWIGGNTAHGVRIGTGVTGVTMTGNTIGGELADGSAAGNGQDGVAITAAIGNTIGAGNVIAKNGRHGVSITDARAETLPAGNRVFASTISGNRSNGVLIGGGSRTTIGGPTVAHANLITGNEADGVRLESTGVTGAATGHVIQRNYVGANPAGDVDSTLGNKGSGIALVGTSDVVVGDANVVMNNGVDGIAVNGGRGVTIGSANAAVGNQIRRNAGHGVSFNGAATGGRVMGNLIEGQGGDGVFVGSGARDVRIGHIVTQSAVSGAANVLHGNTGWGVRVMPGAQRIAVQGNSSFGNMQGSMSRVGANAAAPSSITLNSAVMRTATGGTRQLVVTGTIAGARAKQQFSVDVYASSEGESAQGRRHLGRFNVTATANGQLRFNHTITATVAVDEWISVAATTLVFDPGSTSQLSAPVRAALRR